MSFGGYAIEKNLFDVIRLILPEGSGILELGSGRGSAELAQYYKMTCVEHNPKWYGKYSNINYIKSDIVPHKPTAWHPEETSWYNPKTLKSELANVEYDLLLVDGPPGNIGRGGMLKYQELFNFDIPIIVDDTHRAAEWKVAVVLSRLLKRPVYSPEPEIKKLFSIVAEKEVICSIVNGKG